MHGGRAGFSNILSAGSGTLVPRPWSAVTRLLLHHHRDGGITWTEPLEISVRSELTNSHYDSKTPFNQEKVGLGLSRVDGLLRNFALPNSS